MNASYIAAMQLLQGFGVTAYGVGDLILRSSVISGLLGLCVFPGANLLPHLQSYQELLQSLRDRRNRGQAHLQHRIAAA
jgi:hypothetical protein